MTVPFTFANQRALLLSARSASKPEPAMIGSFVSNQSPLTKKISQSNRPILFIEDWGFGSGKGVEVGCNSGVDTVATGGFCGPACSGGLGMERSPKIPARKKTSAASNHRCLECRLPPILTGSVRLLCYLANQKEVAE